MSTNYFCYGLTIFLNHPDRSTGFVKDITEICKKYDLFHLFLNWATENHAMSYDEWKCTLTNRISIFENSLSETYTENHSHMSLFHQSFTEISPSNYWKITSLYPDLVCKVNIQLRLIGNYGLQSGLPWLRKDKSDACLLCKTECEDLSHFVLRCPYFRNDWIRFWLLMKNFLLQLNDPESELLLFFLKNLNETCRLRFLTNGLILPFNSSPCMKVQKFVAASFRKIDRIRMVRLEETQSKF